MMCRHLCLLIAASLLSLVVPAVAADAETESEPWTFVQVPDFLNLDVGDLTQYDANYTGLNSWNASYATALGEITAAIAAEKPAYVMVAGDLVMARWINDGHSRGGPGIFGPTRGTEAMLDNPSHTDYAATLAAERQRIRNAADFYYPVWQGLFDDAGLTVYGALGDHEIGDDPTFNPGKGGTVLGRETISTYREAFAKHVTDPIADDPNVQVFREKGAQHSGTAYSVRHENVLMVTVDAYRQEDSRALVEDTITRGDGQLAWIEKQLQAAREDDSIDHVIVQGHSPVIYPVKQRASGGHHFVNGTDGEFWQAMLAGGADLYMAGEVHDVDVKQDKHLLQVSSGSLIGRSDMPDQNWLVGRVHEDRIELEVRYLELETEGSVGSFYQPGMRGPGQQDLAGSPNEFRETLIVDPRNRGVQSQGGIVLDKSSGRPVYRDGTGVFAGFNTPVNGLQQNRSFEDDHTVGGTSFNDSVAGWFEEPEDLISAIGSTVDGERYRDSIPDTPHGDNWLNLKGSQAAVYQELGAGSEGQVYGVQMLLGDRSQREWDGLAIQIWRGNGGAADGTSLSSFASLVAETTVTAADWLAEGSDTTDGQTHTFELAVLLETGTRTSADADAEMLWLRLAVIDNARDGTSAQHLVDHVLVNLAGDTDRDGLVGLDDLQTLAANWQATGVGWSGGDVNFDGIVDERDLRLLKTQWGALGEGVGLSFDEAMKQVRFVPEPSLTTMLLPAAGWLLLRR